MSSESHGGGTPTGRNLQRMESLARMKSFAKSFRKVSATLEETVDMLYQAPEEEKPPEPQEVVVQAPTINITATSSAKPAVSPQPVAGPLEGAPQWVIKANEWLAAHPLTTEQIILRDKVSFMIGLLNVMLSSLLLAHPRAFIILFQIKSILLLTSRWVVYRLKGWHYYMFEFCYAAIALGILHTSCLYTHPGLYKVTFALFAGPLTGAVVATRNAFVLHDIDKITSLFQHLSPALVAWLMRWEPSKAIPGWATLTPEQQAGMQSAGIVQLTLIPMAVWLTWALVYFCLVFVLADEKARQRGYATMFTLQTRNPNAPLSRFVFGFKTRRVQYAAYLGVHGTAVFVGCLLTNVWWHSRVAHTLLLAVVLLASIWTGACYYFDVFAVKYKKLLEGEIKAKAS